MKYRYSFISNSSSTSFVCAVCGNQEYGWDGNYDVEYVRCVNNHFMHRDCLPLSMESIDNFSNDNSRLRQYCIKLLQRQLSLSSLGPDEEHELDTLLQCIYKDPDAVDFKSIFREYFDPKEDIFEVGCPICSFEVYDEYLLLKFLMKEQYPNLLTHDALSRVMNSIRERFESYDSFLSYLSTV